ncbi:DUF2218 domain-containing protein [Radicibacter daui]|uniref:DUF2218 domain-containing protein n=1 Tax=Radicibacter daui TaxID=3064829 RepID=UPI004046CC54
MTETPTVAGTVAVATIPTSHASRYLQQMAKHFQHKLPVTFDPHAGTVKFSIGDCGMAASETALTLTLVAADAGQMDQLKDVVVRHLVRFAFREELAIAWQVI